MTENLQPRAATAVWPPRRKPRAERAAATHPKPPWALKGTNTVKAVSLAPSRTLPPPLPPPPLPLPRPASPEPSTPLHDVLNRKRKTQFQNGWEATPKPPSYTPYALDHHTRKRLKASNAESVLPPLARVEPLSEVRWNALAHEAGFIGEAQCLKTFQMQCANAVISRLGDVVVVAPTGAGKSLVWALPLLAVKDGICLVVTPYTSLGIECEQRTNALGLPSVFIYADQRGEAIIERATRGHFRVIFVCPEMLESPTFAVALHSRVFQSRLLAVYIDEAHLVHEAADWRTSYERLHQLRPIVGLTVPLIAISATLPASYQHSLRAHAGLRDSYRLINLGNFRPELSTVVIKLDGKRSSFDSLGFILPDGARVDTVRKTIVYCDDVTMLTDLLWWFHARLQKLHLPTRLVEILHAGLSPTHERIAMQTFNTAQAKIFLATEKVGAGINFPAVEQVIVYLVQKGLTLAKFEQRKGRAGRTSGTTGIGILMVQAELLSAEKHSSVDPAILDLIETKDCMDKVIDRWLDNPPRSTSDEGRLCCSNCHPSLQPSRSLQWVMEDPASKSLSSSPSLTSDEVTHILDELKTWRLRTWEKEWRRLLPGYAPQNLVSDDDLALVAKQAMSIKSVDDLHHLTRIVYWSLVAPALFTALKEVRHSVLGVDSESGVTAVNIDSAHSTVLVVTPRPAASAESSAAAAGESSVSSFPHSSSDAQTKTSSTIRKSQRIVRPHKPRTGTKASKFGEHVLSFM